MKDVEKHVIHWINQAEDLVTSDILIKQKREVQGMFFCHLAVEKALKSHIIKITKDHPIRIHLLHNFQRDRHSQPVCLID